MKKYTYLVPIILITFISQAQEINFGVKAGLNFSNLNGIVSMGVNSNQQEKSIMGVNFGGFTEIKLSQKFIFQPELLYSMQGNKIERNEGFNMEFFKSKTNLGYINIPLITKYFVSNKLFVEVGPQFGMLICIKQDVSNISIFDPGLITNEDNKDIKDLTKKIDYAFNIGFGYEFTKKVFINARYSFGLGNINNIYSSRNKINNEVIQISFGYKI